MKLSPSVAIEHTESGLEFISVNAPFCRARIFLQGAQLSEFVPAGKKPLIWVSEAEDYLAGKSIRGGIPVCWPWFGVHANPEWPSHGVARTMIWRAEQVDERADEIRISLSLPMNHMDETFWPHKSSLTIEFMLSDKLEVRLTNTNLGDEEFTLTQALHTYFPTPAIEETQVDGLQGAKYIEFGEGPYYQDKEVHFTRETDMVYTHASPAQKIMTPDGIIEVARVNSHSCVLWNPWVEKSKRLSNFLEEDYHRMLCLEAANVMDDAVTLAPGESHTLVTRIHWL